MGPAPNAEWVAKLLRISLRLVKMKKSTVLGSIAHALPFRWAKLLSSSPIWSFQLIQKILALVIIIPSSRFPISCMPARRVKESLRARPCKQITRPDTATTTGVQTFGRCRDFVAGPMPLHRQNNGKCMVRGPRVCKTPRKAPRQTAKARYLVLQLASHYFEVGPSLLYKDWMSTMAKKLAYICELVHGRPHAHKYNIIIGHCLQFDGLRLHCSAESTRLAPSLLWLSKCQDLHM